jgi:hypothetical protein
MTFDISSQISYPPRSFSSGFSFSNSEEEKEKKNLVIFLLKKRGKKNGKNSE